MVLEIVALQALFAWSTPLNKLLLAECSPLTLITLRMAVAGVLVLFPYLWWAYKKKRASTTLVPTHLWLFTQKTFFGSYLKYLLKYWGLQYITPVHMAFLFYTTPLWAVLLDYYYFHIRFTLRQLMGFAIAFCGTLPLLLPESVAEPFALWHLFSLPSCAVLVAVGAHCYGVICTKKLVYTYHYNPLLVSGLSSCGTAILALITSCAVGNCLQVAHVSHFAPYFVLLIMISNVIGKTWHTYLLKKHATTTLALAEYLNPIFISVYSYLMWGTGLTMVHCLAASLIVVGITLIKIP